MCSRRAADNAKGSYILLIKLPEEKAMAVGRLGPVLFPCGNYAYIGSALGGLKQRLDRHLRTDEKKLHWHIDYLLEKAHIEEIITCETNERTECAIARALSERYDSIPGFGASDCRCRSHLFYSTDGMVSAVTAVVQGLGMAPGLWTNSQRQDYPPVWPNRLSSTLRSRSTPFISWGKSGTSTIPIPE